MWNMDYLHLQCFLSHELVSSTLDTFFCSDWERKRKSGVTYSFHFDPAMATEGGF